VPHVVPANNFRQFRRRPLIVIGRYDCARRSNRAWLTTGRVWLARLRPNGKVAIYRNPFNAGRRETWTASDKLLLWSGQCRKRVSKSSNGKSLQGRLGAPGEVVKVAW